MNMRGRKSSAAIEPSVVPTSALTGLRSFSRTFSSLQNYNYRLYWFGQLLSVIGTWIARIAQAWLVLQLTNSSFALGLVTALASLPITFFALFGGVLADRFPKRRVIVITQSIMAAQALILGLLITTHHIQVWQIYILAMVLGLATSIDNPTRQAFVSEMVGPENLPNAVALNSSLFNTARIIGPAIGGGLIAAFSIAVPFYVNAISFTAVIGGLLLMRPAEFHDVPVPVRGRVLTRMREGISYAVRTPAVLLPLILLAFIGTFGYNFTVILPLVAKYVLHTGALGFGGLTTALGIGALVSALTMAYLNRPSERLLLAGGTAFTILLGLLAVSTVLPLTLLILVVLGFASITYTATTNTRLQISAPGQMRGRVMSFYILLNAGMTPVGSLLIGTLAQDFDVRVALGIMTCLCAVGVVVAWLYYARRSRVDANRPPAKRRRRHRWINSLPTTPSSISARIVPIAGLLVCHGPSVANVNTSNRIRGWRRKTTKTRESSATDRPKSTRSNEMNETRSFGRIFSSLHNYNYRLYWFGQLLSITGTWIARIAQAWLVLQLTNSSFALGLVGALQFIPITVFSLFGGVLADRFPKREVIIITQALMAVQSLILAILITTGEIRVWHIYILAMVLGLASAFGNPTRQAFISEMVGPENLSNAVALNSGLFNTARILGPAVGGALIAAFTIDIPFYINAVSYLAVIGGLLMMRPSEFFNVPAPVRGRVLARLREGIDYATKTPAVLLPLILMGFIGTFGYNFTVMLPLVAKYILGTGALGFGGLMTAIGVGSLAAALGVAYMARPTERLLLIGGTAFSILLGLVAISHLFPLTVAILVLLGVASIAFTTTANARLQLTAPDELRGRVMSLYIFLRAGTAPAGSLLLGFLAQRASVPISVGTMAALCITGVVLARFYRSRHPDKPGMHQPQTLHEGVTGH